MNTYNPEAVKRYKAKSYSRVSLEMKKEEKELIKAHAEEMEETMNGFIKRAIKMAMEYDKEKPGKP